LAASSGPSCRSSPSISGQSAPACGKSCSRPGEPLTTRQYGRLVDEWVALISLYLAAYGTHSLCRTKVALIYRRTNNLRACPLLLGHTKLESTFRDLGIEADDAPMMSGQTNI